MKPIEFEGANVVYAADQPEYLSLPAHMSYKTAAREVTSCWELTEEELAEVIKTRRIYFTVLTFGHPLQPQLPSVVNPCVVRFSIQEFGTSKK